MTESGAPDTVFKDSCGIDFVTIQYICMILFCDMDDPESSITSGINISYNHSCLYLSVATVTVLVGLLSIRDIGCPSEASPFSFPAVTNSLLLHDPTCVLIMTV